MELYRDAADEKDEVTAENVLRMPSYWTNVLMNPGSKLLKKKYPSVWVHFTGHPTLVEAEHP